MRSRRALPIPSSLSPTCCSSSRAATASCSRSAGSAIIGASPRPSTMPRARPSTRRPSCSASPIPAAPRSRRWLRQATPPPFRCLARWSAPANRISPSPVSRARSSAPSRPATSGQRTSPRAFSRRWSIASSTARASRSQPTDAPTLVVAGGVAANQAIRVAPWPISPMRTAGASACRPAGCAPTMRR